MKVAEDVMSYAAYRLLCRFLAPFVLLLGIPSLCGAQAVDSVVGFSDHSLIDGYEESEIVDRQLQRDINYRIILGGLERVRGEVIPENSERLRGDVTKITYEVSEEFTGADVYEFFQQQLASRNYELLFDCEGRACGSSNYWANDIFRNRILYGPERNQYFMVFRSDSGSEDAAYFSLYIITRVNRTIYAYLEIVEPHGTLDPEQIAAPAIEEPQPVISPVVDQVGSNLLRQLQQRGSVVLPAYEFQSNDQLVQSADIEALVSALNVDPSVSFYLVAHLQENGQSLQQLTARSVVRANSLRQALIAAGVNAQRIEAAGVGPLAPNCAGGECRNRIELVLQ